MYKLIRLHAAVLALKLTRPSARSQLRLEIQSGHGDLRGLAAGTAIQHLARRSSNPLSPLQLTLFSRSTSDQHRVRPLFDMKSEDVLIYSGNELKAVLRLLEGTILGFPTGYFRLESAKGELAILAEAGTEDYWLKTGLELLFKSRRAFLVLVNCKCNYPHDNFRPQGVRFYQQQTQHFWQQFLGADFDSSLAPLGKRTRRNLRYVLTHARKDGWQFVPDLSPLQLADAVNAIRPTCTHPFSAENAAERIRASASMPGYFAAGLQNEKGQWISCLVGVRSRGCADVIWQVNSPDAKRSIGMTLRAYLMQHEVSRTTERIRFISGTGPLLEHLCTPTPVSTITFVRPGLRQLLLRLLPSTWLRGCSSILGDALGDQSHPNRVRHMPVEKA